MQGDDVARVHQALQALGREVPAAERSNRVLGAGSVAALRALQAELRLPPTGVVEAATVKAIDARLATLPTAQRVVGGSVRDAKGDPFTDGFVQVLSRGPDRERIDDIADNGVKPVSTNTHRFPEGSFFTIEAVLRPGLFGGVEAAVEAHVTASHLAARGTNAWPLRVGVAQVPASAIDDMGKSMVKGPMPGLQRLPVPDETVFLPEALDQLNKNATWTILRVNL
jgi:hypothetical protein